MIIEGTNLSMIRGDTEVIEVACQDSEGTPVSFENGDTIYFTVKVNTNTVSKVLQKEITEFVDGVAYIQIEHEDTNKLPYLTFVYDIQLTRADGTVKTIIPPSKFTILEEVTYE
ncbi:MAG: hypothetical protein ACOYJ1_13345 [Peptococcales bacterium]|jgi:hypothetical protein